MKKTGWSVKSHNFLTKHPENLVDHSSESWQIILSNKIIFIYELPKYVESQPLQKSIFYKISTVFLVTAVTSPLLKFHEIYV